MFTEAVLDPDAEAGQTTGVTSRIDDSIDAAHVKREGASSHSGR
ncbi:hypothetical protein [Streptomyces inhibens]|nr:hypothetical protein [Streptomyces inhibens]